MTHSSARILSILLLTTGMLAACADTTTEPAAPELAPLPVKIETIPATDELGSFQTPVSGISLWNHPAVPFESTVIAANGEAGLIMINFEREAVATLQGSFNYGVTLSYISTADGKKTIIAARDDAEDRIRLITTTLAPLEMTDWWVSGDTSFLERNTAAACIVKSESEQHVIVMTLTKTNQLSHASVSENGTGALVISDVENTPIADIVGCVSDDRDGTAFLLSEDGQIFAADMFSEQATTNLKPLVKLPAGDVVELAVNLQGDGNGQLLAMVSSGSYVIYVYDLKTAESLGAFTLGEFSGINSVDTISAFTVDGSNFGGLYRDGAIAIVEGEESYALKLAPWTAVTNILELPEAETLDRRFIGEIERPDNEGLIIDLPDLGLGDQ